MSYKDPKDSQQPREQTRQPAQTTGPSVAPGKRTLTSRLPPGPAGAPPPVQQKPDPAAAAARSERAELTARWIDTATRPDLYPPPVQRKRAGSIAEPASDIHHLAAQGISGSASNLPHLDQIQSSFGGHDVSGIESHIGGPATPASQAMGARAYATGNHVAFRETPDLHTAAHEAAHVVQQRAGVHFKDGVGRSNDIYEHHADRVADLVVRGQSAESALDEMAAGRTTEPSMAGPVQRLEDTSSAVSDEGTKSTDPDSESIADQDEQTNPKLAFTESETIAFDLGLNVPISGPVKCEVKIAGSYAVSNTSDGPKTEVEGVLYGGILVDLYIMELRAGIEGKVKFTIRGDTDIITAIKKGTNEIVNWKIANDFEPKLREARSAIKDQYNSTLDKMAGQMEVMFIKTTQENFTDAVDGANILQRLIGIRRPRDWVEAYAKDWNDGFTNRFESLGAKVYENRLMDTETISKLLDDVGKAENSEVAQGKLFQAQTYVFSELHSTRINAQAALDRIQVVKNDPDVGFQASVAFKAGMSLQATSNTSAGIEYADVSSIEDKDGSEGWNTDVESAKIVTGKLGGEGWETSLAGEWKKNSIDITGSFKKIVSAAPNEDETKKSISSVLNAVKKQGATFESFFSIKNTAETIKDTAETIVTEVRSIVSKNIAQPGKDSWGKKQSREVEVKLTFQKEPFKLVGGSVKISVVSKIDSESPLLKTGIGVSGSLSMGTSFEASWGS